MALTKADFAERLFDELGLNKREAKEMIELFFEEIKGSLEMVNKLKSQGLESLNYGTKVVVLVEIQKQVKKFPLQHVV